jgi:dipeptidyl aminopeptidase/acylaminoacyl peptidase
MRRAATVVAIVTVLAGCGGDGSHRVTTAAPSATATRTTPAPPAPRSQTVQFKATDGETVTGDYTPAGRGAPALVLLHENRFSREQWEPLVPYLHAAGFATLAYDSRASLVEDKRLPDALGAVRWLRARRDVDRRRIGLVGADIGGSTAVLAAITGARRDVRAVVALSPDSSKTIADRQ